MADRSAAVISETDQVEAEIRQWMNDAGVQPTYEVVQGAVLALAMAHAHMLPVRDDTLARLTRGFVQLAKDEDLL